MSYPDSYYNEQNSAADYDASNFMVAAADSTRRMLENADDMTFSGCVKITRDVKKRRYIEYFYLICVLAVILAGLALICVGLIERKMFVVIPAVLLCVVALTMWPLLKRLFMRFLLKRRKGSLIGDYGHLPWIYVNVEDGKTYQTFKLVSEDEGVCIFDAENRRILIEGVIYRYMICADDMNMIQPVTNYSVNGTLLNCRIGGKDVELYMTAFGQCSMLLPGLPANRITLANRINFTLFGAVMDEYRKPPAMPDPNEQ